MLTKGKNTAQAMGTQTKVGTLIGAGAIFNGNLTAPDTVRIDGSVNGNCVCEKNLVVGQDGHIEGNITAQNVVISGRVNGDIIAGGKLELFSTAKVTGDVTAKSLVVDENAYFEGRCAMTTSEQPASTAPELKAAEESSDADT